jgi:branched-chain amino acid transport system ATP-binding protein
MLEITDLHVSYGRVEAVRGFSATVRPGRITLVLGANGAGKTTSLRAISGLLPAVSGSVRLKDREVLGRPAHRLVGAGLVMVPEGRRIFAPLTVEENLRIGGYRAPRSSIAVNLDRVYGLFPILKDRRSGTAGLLSGGEQQMLAFGRALMSTPDVMLLDEPSMGLAPVVVDTIIASVREIADSGIGVLMVEQNADTSLEVADDVVVVSRGEVTYSGPPDARLDDAMTAPFRAPEPG